MARVEVDLARAERGDLPSVCVISGRPAAGFCPLPVGRSWGRSTEVRLPLAKDIFDRWHRRSMLRLRAGLGLGFCVFAAVATIRFPTVASIFVALAFGLGGGWFYATWSLPSVTPAMFVDEGTLVLTDAHPRFAAVVGT